MKRDRESGQSLIEFALVLPFLILLTFGCFQAAIFFSHQMTLSGATFLGARAAAVRGPEATAAAKDVILSYAQASGQKWLSYAQRTASVELGDGLAKVSLVRNESWLDAVTQLLARVGGKAPPKEVHLKQSTWLHDEFMKKASGGVGSASTIRTSLMIDYTVGVPVNIPGLDTFGGAIASLKSIPGLGEKLSLDNVLIAANPLAQATVPNPQKPSEQGAQNSDQYLDAANETKYFQQAGKLASGLEGAGTALDIAGKAYAALGGAAGVVPEPTTQAAAKIAQRIMAVVTPLDPALERARNTLSQVEPFFKAGGH